MKVGSLFAGIGGFDLGLEMAGFEIAWQVENDPFCQKILAKHWPNVKRYGDIKNVKNLEAVDLICGGWPCQPFSLAGQRKGKTDDRYLWPEMLRVIQETKPTWIVGENVTGFISMGLDDCITDLEREGYEVQPLIIPACSVGAPHRRDRIWIIAYKDSNDSDPNECRLQRKRPEQQASGAGQLLQNSSDTTDAQSKGLEGRNTARSGSTQGRTTKHVIGHVGNYQSQPWDEPWPSVAARLCRVDDGLPRRMDKVKRLKALGNAIVPQIAEIIGRAIMKGVKP